VQVTLVFEGPLKSPWKDYEMRKGFTRKPQVDAPATPGKNYITPSRLQRLKDEHRILLSRERPAVTEVVAWAASNGDRSENADYQYGKRRLRQIDGRIRFLTKRIDAAEVVDPEAPRAGQAATRAFFGATVRFPNAAGAERVVSILMTACLAGSPMWNENSLRVTRPLQGRSATGTHHADQKLRTTQRRR
jgi:transcription elongation GreA/GreB family factor